MRFGWLQVLLGLALIASSIALGGMAYLLVWPAIAVTAVGLGYVGLGPSVFGKRKDGTLALPQLILLLPYHAVAWARVRWDAFRLSEDPWNLVAPGLYLGRIVSADELPPNTRVVVDLTSEFPASAAIRTGREYYNLPALDASVPRYEDFDLLVRAVAAHDGPTYVHCAAGRGRSATFAAAVLVARGQALDVDQAEATLRASRPGVRLHPVQRALVRRFTAELAQRPLPSVAQDPSTNNLVNRR